MSNNRTLTTANSSFALQIDGLFPVPVNIQGYSTDNMFSTASINNAELKMGADGRLSAGYTFVEKPFTFVLQADSESNDVMDAWIAAEEAQKEKLIANGIVIISGINSKFAMTRGFLGDHVPMTEAGKTAQPRSYTITFETISKAPG